MEFYRTWRILMAHKFVLIALPVIATCVALGLSFLLPEQYESTALVLVRPFEEIKFNSSDNDQKVSEFPVNLSAPIDALSKTYVEVIKSPAVAVRIVDALQLQIKKPKMDRNPFEAIKDSVGTWVGNAIRTMRNYFKYGRDIPATPFDRAVEDVEATLTVSVRKDTYAFDITARSHDPAQAAAIANMAARIFVEHSSQAYQRDSARSREFIGKQLQQSQKELYQAQASVLSFQRSNGTFELTSEYNTALKSVSELQNTIAKDQAELAGLRRLAGRSTPNLLAQEVEVAQLKAEISQIMERLAAFPQEETQFSRLKLAERLAEDSYGFFRKRYDEARVKEAEKVSEIRIVSPAVPTLYPVKPLKYVFAIVSFSTALVIAIGLALLMESLEPRVRTIRDLETELGVPVLGAIPRSLPDAR
jgi:uncharacterized protein involved in exopolysaccharide biosynthesis